MYQITCDDYILYDGRDADLIVSNPRCKLAVNSVGEGSFAIHKTHPFYGWLKKLKSVVEFRQDNEIIFRGRITNDALDLRSTMQIDLEGMLGVTNDSMIPPFSFPNDFTIGDGQNVVEVLLSWFIDRHNAQVQPFQQLIVGTVTVSDPNNVILRSSSEYMTTWEALKKKLFGSGLGGYLCARYEADGTYVDYLSEFTLMNTQTVELTENMLDLSRTMDATGTCSACIPVGADIEDADTEEKTRLTLTGLADGDLTNDIVKSGEFIYSRSAVDSYGWVCAPIKDTTWDDVTDINNLKRKAVEWLSGTGVMLESTIKIKAIDLHMVDSEIQRFRPCRNIRVNSAAHGLDGAIYPLTEMSVDLFSPQNTTITIGDTHKTLIDQTGQSESDLIDRIEKTGELVDTVQDSVTAVRQQVLLLETSVVTTCEEMILEAARNYVKTGDFETYKETVTAQLQIMADSIAMNFSATKESISDVNGDLQNKFQQLTKYIRFSVNGIELGSTDHALKLTLDNDRIQFTNNGVLIGWWDGTDFHTGNVVVEVNERAQFGNFAFIPRNDGSLMFLKVGDVTDNSATNIVGRAVVGQATIA